MPTRSPTIFLIAASFVTHAAYLAAAHTEQISKKAPIIQLANLDKSVPPRPPSNKAAKTGSKIYEGLSILEQEELRKAIEQSQINLDELIRNFREHMRHQAPNPE